MATVTKLKAAVNNKNLPILGSDGNLHNYYVGRWENKLSELGYNPTNSELNAVKSFVERGIQDGWIDEVKYFMPFIGPQSAPLTGMVPLIDQVADYQLAVETVDEELFNYSNGKIVGIGGRDDNANTETKLPFTTYQINSALDFAFSFYFDCMIESSDLGAGLKGKFFTATDSNGNYVALRKGSSTQKVFQYINRLNGATSNGSPIGISLPTEDETPKEISAMWGVYKLNGTQYRIRTNIRQGDSALRAFDVSGFSTEITEAESTYSIGPSTQNLIIKINIAAVLNPLISDSAFFNYSNAVFDLTLALGRR